MPRRPLDSPLSIVILGLLAEQQLHPYAMRVLIRERGHTRIVGRSPASLYDAVGRLATAGYVEALEPRQEGRRPERTLYRLTESGAHALQAWVRQALADVERADQFTAALSFMYVLPKRVVIALLTRRQLALDAVIETGDVALADALAGGVSPIFLSEGRYSRALLQAKHDWLASFIAQLSSGQLRWPRPRRSPEAQS
jgi:DNA-binding PadR family transcriptional regulator